MTIVSPDICGRSDAHRREVLQRCVESLAAQSREAEAR
jgi:hypothetical protein